MRHHQAHEQDRAAEQKRPCAEGTRQARIDCRKRGGQIAAEDAQAKIKKRKADIDAKAQRDSEERQKAEANRRVEEETARRNEAPTGEVGLIRPKIAGTGVHALNIQNPQPRPQNSLCNYRCFYGSKTGLNDPLGRALEQVLSVPGDSLAATNIISEMANSEDSLAQYYYGIFHMRGVGMPFSASKGASWLRRAADHGNALARLEIARLYRDGEGVPRNPFQALKYFKLAAEQDVPEAAEE